MESLSPLNPNSFQTQWKCHSLTQRVVGLHSSLNICQRPVNLSWGATFCFDRVHLFLDLSRMACSVHQIKLYWERILILDNGLSLIIEK